MNSIYTSKIMISWLIGLFLNVMISDSTSTRCTTGACCATSQSPATGWRHQDEIWWLTTSLLLGGTNIGGIQQAPSDVTRMRYGESLPACIPGGKNMGGVQIPCDVIRTRYRDLLPACYFWTVGGKNMGAVQAPCDVTRTRYGDSLATSSFFHGTR